MFVGRQEGAVEYNKRIHMTKWTLRSFEINSESIWVKTDNHKKGVLEESDKSSSRISELTLMLRSSLRYSLIRGSGTFGSRLKMVHSAL